jgi:hypothetical protein
MNEEDLVKLLTSIDWEVLVNFAKRHGVDASGKDKTALAVQIVRTVPDVVIQNIRQVLRLELSHTEANLEAALEKKLRTEMKEIEVLKWVFGSVAGIIALTVTVGGIFGIKRAADLEDLRNSYQQQVATQAVLIENQKLFQVSQVMDSTDVILRDISLYLTNDSAFNQAEHNIELLAYPSRSDSLKRDSDAVAILLTQLNRAILLLRDVRSQPSDLNIIDRAAKTWRGATSPKVTDQRFMEFVKDVQAYVPNVLGILELIRFKAAGKNDLNILEAANEQFNIGMKSNPDFARIYSNLGVTAAYSYDLRRGKGKRIQSPMAVLVGLLEKSRTWYERARSHSDSPRSRSITLNNLAMIDLREAHLLLDSGGQKDQAQEKLDSGLTYLDAAKNIGDRDWGVFETIAQILALKIVINGSSDVQRPAQYAQVREAILTAASESGDCNRYLKSDVPKLDELRDLQERDASFAVPTTCQ